MVLYAQRNDLVALFREAAPALRVGLEMRVEGKRLAPCSGRKVDEGVGQSAAVGRSPSSWAQSCLWEPAQQPGESLATAPLAALEHHGRRAAVASSRLHAAWGSSTAARPHQSAGSDEA
eukprot:6211327-Pleurochrysis_carterae.AAC.2